MPNRDELGALAVNLNRMNDELRRLYEELGTVSRHKSEFLANMSHELRTPLNAIIGFSELLQQQVRRVERAPARLRGGRPRAGRHLLLLINDILDLSKVEAGKMELDISTFSLRPTLERALVMHAERANQEGVALGLRLDPDEIAIRADERRLRQVVFNLLSNAVKFTPAGGRIDVEARMSDGVVEVAVADNGFGIAPDDQELIFEEFRQAPRRQAERGDGIGTPTRKEVHRAPGRTIVGRKRAR